MPVWAAHLCRGRRRESDVLSKLPRLKPTSQWDHRLEAGATQDVVPYVTNRLVLCHALIFGLSPPAPVELGSPVRARRASGGTGPRAGALGSDAARTDERFPKPTRGRVTLH